MTIFLFIVTYKCTDEEAGLIIFENITCHKHIIHKIVAALFQKKKEMLLNRYLVSLNQHSIQRLFGAHKS